MNYENNMEMSIWNMNCEKKLMFAIQELWKYENLCLQYMNYENRTIVCNTWIMKICLQYMNYEKNMFVYNTRIIKTWKKCLFAIHELWKYLFKIHELWNVNTVH